MKYAFILFENIKNFIMKKKILLTQTAQISLSRLLVVLAFLLTSLINYGQVSFDIDKSGSSVADPGDLITYTISYSNTGTTQATNVVITDILPDAAEWRRI